MQNLEYSEYNEYNVASVVMRQKDESLFDKFLVLKTKTVILN